MQSSTVTRAIACRSEDQMDVCVLSARYIVEHGTASRNCSIALNLA
jgi:hypothetical protein